MTEYETKSLALLEQIAANTSKAAAAAPIPTAAGGAVFPFGTSKGKPVFGADVRSLEFFRGACLKTLADPDKQRFHDKERGLLAAIDAEMARQGIDQRNDPPPPSDADAPPDDGTGAPF